MVRRIVTHLFRKIAFYLSNLSEEKSIIKLDADADIHPTATIERSFLKGVIVMGVGSKVFKSHLEGKIFIGRYTSISGPNTDLIAKINSITVGNFCSIARNVSVQEMSHRTDSLTSYFIFQHVFKEKNLDETSKGAITIGSDVWIGTQTVILSGVKIGNGAIIAANSVVTKDVPDFAIVGGVPAKIIKYRFEQPIVEKLLVLKWWDWDLNKIINNKKLFEGSLTIDKLKNIV